MHALDLVAGSFRDWQSFTCNTQQCTVVLDYEKSSLKLIFTYFNCLVTQQTGLCLGSGSGFSGCDGKERQP